MSGSNVNFITFRIVLTVKFFPWAVVLALLVQQSLPTPEIRGSTPVIANFILQSTVLNNPNRKDKIKKKSAGKGPIFKLSSNLKV